MNIFVNSIVSGLLALIIGGIILTIDYFLCLLKFQTIKNHLSSYPQVVELINIIIKCTKLLSVVYSVLLLIVFNIAVVYIYIIMYTIYTIQLKRMTKKWK